MNIVDLNKELGNIDIYLLDQILKGRYDPSMKLLDAGCGEGRNLTYFLKNGYSVYAIDNNPGAIRMLRFIAASLRGANSSTIREENIEEMQFEDNYFDLVICSAVLHFAKDDAHFEAMFKALLRVLKAGGNLFIRMASAIGIEDRIVALGNGSFSLPDGSVRYLLRRNHLEEIFERHKVAYVEPIKTVNVADQRCMSTLILRKL